MFWAAKVGLISISNKDILLTLALQQIASLKNKILNLLIFDQLGKFYLGFFIIGFACKIV